MKIKEIKERYCKEALSGKIRLYICILLLAVIVGYLALVAVYALPTDAMTEHMLESTPLFEAEGNYPTLMGGDASSMLDNFTDAWILLIAGNKQNESVWKEALLGKHMWDGNSPITTLADTFHAGSPIHGQALYDRYWHGYLVFIKPLLLFFNYQEIRYIFMAVQMAMLFAVVYLLGKRDMNEYLIPLLGAYLFINPAACLLSLQFAPMWLLTLAQFIVILYFDDAYRENRGLWTFHFLLAGCLAVYFDFLTYPLITFGLPMALLLTRHGEDRRTGLWDLVRCGLTWGVGYGVMWAGKWVLASLFTDQNVIAEALKFIRFRTMGGVEGYENLADGYGYGDVLIRNWTVNTPVLCVAAIALVVCMIVGLRRGNRLDQRSIPLFVVALLPFVWFFVLRNHTFIHCFYTYRTLAVLVFAALCLGVLFATPPQNSSLSGKTEKGERSL